jgi:hypothetical protein
MLVAACALCSGGQCRGEVYEHFLDAFRPAIVYCVILFLLLYFPYHIDVNSLSSFL